MGSVHPAIQIRVAKDIASVLITDLID